MFKIIFLCAFCILMAMPVAGEYYQYKDAQGNYRFTDDTANIPENKQMDMKSYESIDSNDFLMPSEGDASPGSSQGDNSHLLSPDASDLPDQKALEEMRAALEQTVDSLEAQHQELEAQVPGTDASKLQINAYNEKVKALNLKMEEYKKQHQAYNKKVSAYNARNTQEAKDNAGQ